MIEHHLVKKCVSDNKGGNKMKKKIIIISCFDWYDKRIKYIKNFYKKNSFEVIVLLSDFDHISKVKISEEKRYLGCVYIDTMSYKKNISLKRIVSHMNFVSLVKKMVIQENPDIVYSLIPPNFLVSMLSKLKSKIRYKLVYDLIDLWPENMPIDKFYKTFPYKCWKNIRDKKITYADFINLECNMYRDYLPKAIPKEKIHTFYILKKETDQFGLNNLIRNNNNFVDVCYLGSINNIIDIDRIVTTLKKISFIKPVRIKIIGAGEKADDFILNLKKNNIKVEYFGAVYEWERIVNIVEDCHFGINIYKKNLKVGITTKSIDYFQLGLPILNSIKGDTEELVNKHKIGINIDEYNSLDVENIINNIAVVKAATHDVFDMFFNEISADDQLKWLIETL